MHCTVIFFIDFYSSKVPNENYFKFIILYILYTIFSIALIYIVKVKIVTLYSLIVSKYNTVLGYFITGEINNVSLGYLVPETKMNHKS